MGYGNYPDLQNVKKILVIKMRHHGDVLLTTPVFRTLKKRFPQALIGAYIYRTSFPLLEGNQYIDRIHSYDQKGKKEGLWKKTLQEIAVLREIRKEKYDLVINLTEGDRGAIAAWISRAFLRVGIDPGKQGMLAKRRFFTHLAKPCPTERHTVERNLDLLRLIGIFPEEDERELDFSIPDTAKKRVYEEVQRAFGPFQDYIVVHPVSRWMFKAPPFTLMVKVIKALLDRGERIVLSSGSDSLELEYCRKIKEALETNSILDLSGQMNLKELGALIQSARALITVDSLPLHIASVFKTPVVVLFGPTSENSWGPWRHPNAHIVARKMSCRPCRKDGCGSSKRSDCLYTLDSDEIVQTFYSLKSSPKYEDLASLLFNSAEVVPESSTLPSRIR